MKAADTILTRLDGVKPTGAGRWIARCPGHEDRSPSLSIRELDDGRILIHDFGGCSTQLVLQCLGLDFGDLFDKPLAHHLPPVRGGFTSRELLELIGHEASVAAILASDSESRPMTANEQQRLMQAAARISSAQALANGR